MIRGNVSFGDRNRSRTKKRQQDARNKILSVKRSGATLGFVPRSFGNPRAITERKYFDTTYTVAAINAITTSFASSEADPGTLLTLFVPQTGDDFNSRTGRKCQVISIKIKASIIINNQVDQTVPDFAAIIRIMLVQDKQTNAAQLNSEDVITSGAASGAINMFQNPAFFGRFRVLKDKHFVMQNPNLSWDGTNMEQQGLAKHFNWTIKFRKPVTVHFNSTNGGTIADIIDNSFHVLAAYESQANNLSPTLVYKARVTYLDI